MEAPLSRVEAILQNILGADNVLVPPQSRVEEILLAILNNTEYIHPGDPSRVEEILLAIKDGGSYDKKALSRVEDILIHKLNDEEYTDYSEDDLSRVEKLLIQWIDLHPEVIKELTTSSFPISILANGLPLLDYRIYGNTVQNGTPTPDNPIMPQGTGERTGNLWNAEGFSARAITSTHEHTNTNSYGTTISSTIGKEVSVTQANYPTGNVGYQNGFFFLDVDFSKYSIGDVITLSFDYIVDDVHALSTQTSTTLYAGKNNNAITPILSSGDWKISGRLIAVITIMADMNPYVEVRLCGNSITVKNIMLNTGSTALPYEPYGIKIPILSANTTTPVYLGEVETTRRVKKLVFDGTENWIHRSGAPSNEFFIEISNINFINNLAISTHYLNQDSGSFDDLQENHIIARISLSGNKTYIGLRDGNFPATGQGANQLKEWLAQQYANGTPVTIWYVLANETTGIVNEPLMKIGDYADSVDFSQAGIEIPTLKKPNTTVIDVETEVEPSSMYLKYAEPSDGPAPKTPVLGTKDREIYVTPNNEVYVLRR